MANLSELPLIAEIGLKKLESLCDKILEYKEDGANIEAKQKKSNSVIKSVKPKITEEFVQVTYLNTL